MSNFSLKLNTIAINTDTYLKSVFSKQKEHSQLIKPMKYSIFFWRQKVLDQKLL